MSSGSGRASRPRNTRPGAAPRPRPRPRARDGPGRCAASRCLLVPARASRAGRSRRRAAARRAGDRAARGCGQRPDRLEPRLILRAGARAVRERSRWRPASAPGRRARTVHAAREGGRARAGAPSARSVWRRRPASRCSEQTEQRPITHAAIGIGLEAQFLQHPVLGEPCRGSLGVAQAGRRRGRDRVVPHLGPFEDVVDLHRLRPRRPAAPAWPRAWPARRARF